MTGSAEHFPLEPALDFLRHLWALNHAIERVSLQMDRTDGVTAQQRAVLRCIGKYPGMTPSRLADLLHLDRGTISVALSRLAAKGLVTRRRDPRDGRRVSLGLSTDGRRLDHPDDRTIERVVERLLKEADQRDVAATKVLLKQLAERLAARVSPPRQARSSSSARECPRGIRPSRRKAPSEGPSSTSRIHPLAQLRGCE